MEANARKRGLMPRGLRKKFPFRRNRKTPYRPFSRTVRTPSQIPSLFSRDNYESMQLLIEFPEVKFKFTKIKHLFALKRKLKRNANRAVVFLRQIRKV